MRISDWSSDVCSSDLIAGVVNPPSSGKYQYWTFDGKAASLDEFIEKASETQGSWWPDWMEWIRPHAGKLVPATGARIPGGNPKYPAIEDATGRYVTLRPSLRKRSFQPARNSVV